MIRLDTTTRKLQAVMAGAKTTTQPTVTVSYFMENDRNERTRGATQIAALNDTTDVDICAAPKQNYVVNVDTVTVFNGDTVTQTITIKIDDNGTDSILVKRPVAAGETLAYENNSGWQIL